MSIAVVNGATLQCTCGSATATLTVTSQTKIKIGDQLAATVMDCAFPGNIPGFGTCTVLTAAASGVSTPCAMVPSGTWSPGSTSVVNVGHQPGLLDTDVLMCSVPGTITVTNPGQQKTSDA